MAQTAVDSGQSLFVASLAVLLAYLLTNSWAWGDEPSAARPLGKRTIVRSLVHLVVLIASLALFDPAALSAPVRFAVWTLAYLIAQAAVDLIRIRSDRPARDVPVAWTFVVRQVLHLCIIIAFADTVSGAGAAPIAALLGVAAPLKFKILVGVTVYAGSIFAGGQLIRQVTRPIADHIPAIDGVSALPNAGLYIGWLERLLIVTAVLMKSPTVIGLIFAGKSIARFTELKDQRFAEYFLIGTFLSVALALLGGILIQLCWYGTAQLG
ncbi:MAG TPA: hypothetical protein VKT51_00415 [Candidatus Eremiobacteraceae bacterium]|nr:hypothetical protein [Candidatus Eremiobacteraceae bacterium]